jgi:hypothetical protein
MSEFDIKDFSASEKNLKGEKLKSIQKIEHFQKYFKSKSSEKTNFNKTR